MAFKGHKGCAELSSPCSRYFAAHALGWMMGRAGVEWRMRLGDDRREVGIRFLTLR